MADFAADHPIPTETVERSTGSGYWTVAATGWGTCQLTLSAEYAELLAPPIVVGVAHTPRAPQGSSDSPGRAKPVSPAPTPRQLQVSV